MVDRGSDDGQADGHVHSGVQAEHLDRDVTLVVVGGDDEIEFAFRTAQEDRVRRPRSAGVDSLLACRRDGGREALHLLAAEQPVLARVRIDAGDGDPR